MAASGITRMVVATAMMMGNTRKGVFRSRQMRNLRSAKSPKQRRLQRPRLISRRLQRARLLSVTLSRHCLLKELDLLQGRQGRRCSHLVLLSLLGVARPSVPMAERRRALAKTSTTERFGQFKVLI